MDSKYIVPFITSIQKVFATMLRMSVKIGTPTVSEPATAKRYDISGIIGMSGDIDGAVVLSFGRDEAEQIVERFTGMKLASDHEDFADAVGELVNMISGAAKAQFEGQQVSISCPSVVVGHDHLVFNRKDVLRIDIPCRSECGDFVVEVAIRRKAAQSNTVGAA